MNTDNYCTIEAAQKLIDNGIVLETVHYWRRPYGCSYWKITHNKHSGECISAPSPAEVWRELCKICKPCIYFSNEVTLAVIEGSPSFYNTNLTDALIDLLIWVRKKKK